MIYIIVFIITVFFTFLAEKNKNRKILFILLSICAISAPVLLAGLRDSSIGTDTEVYLAYFDNALFYDTFHDFILDNLTVEKGFLLLIYSISRLTSDPRYFLILCHILIVCPVYISLFKMDKNISPSLGMIIFLLIFYNESMNQMRQYISISFIFLAITFFINDKKNAFGFFVFVAIFFHTTAVLGIMWPIIFYLTKRFPLKSHFLIYISLSIVLVFSFVYFLPLELLSMVDTNISSKYESYISKDTTTMSVSNSTLFVNSISFILILLYNNKIKKDEPILDSFAIMAFFAVLTLFLSPISRALYRLSLDFNILCCLSIPYVFSSKSSCCLEKIHLHKFLSILYVILCIIYWCFAYCVRGSNDTFPYVVNSLL